MNKCDIAIIGSGPAGYVAAIRASQLGMKVCVIEKSDIGGICLNWGCIPTKALLKSAEIYNTIKNADEFGILATSSFDFTKIINRSRNVAKQLNNGVIHLLKKNNVDILKGKAEIISDKKLIVINDQGEKKEINASNFIIASGARARSLGSIQINHKNVWDYTDAMTSKYIPKNLTIIGSGAIGMEFAYFYNTFGSNVTIIEKCNRIMINEDIDIANFIKDEFEKKGVKFITSAEIISHRLEGTQTILNIRDDRKEEYTIKTDQVLSSVGLVPNTEFIDMEKLGIEHENGFIKVDQYMRTSVRSIYAIGDVNNQKPMLAHKSSHEGIICVDYIATGKSHKIDYSSIPACTYITPQVASIGLTEEKALLQNRKIRVGKFPLLANGKAVAIGKTDGFIKVIYGADNGEIIGVHMVGENVTELIHSFSIAKSSEITDEEIENSIFPHPTISEIIQEATLASKNKQIHI